MNSDLKDGETYFIKIISGRHKGKKCEAVYYEGFQWFEAEEITVLLCCVEVIGLGVEALQEIDLKRIAETTI